LYFHPPEEIQTDVFARLPEGLRIRSRRSGWAFGKGDGVLHSFLEGPSFDRTGNLYLVDIPYGRILSVSPEGVWRVVTEYDGWPNGLKIHRDGRIFIADHRRGIMQLDRARPVSRTRPDGFFACAPTGLSIACSAIFRVRTASC
jgi:gluconolactonase